jgi:hypothetical protein
MRSNLREPSAAGAQGADSKRPGEQGTGSARRLVEIRAYRLKPGTRAAFRAALVERALPMVRAAGLDVVTHGPGVDDDSYFLVRAFDDLADLTAREDAFYGSAPWREGPRESVVSLIETYVDTLLWMAPASVEDLRRENAGVA